MATKVWFIRYKPTMQWLGISIQANGDGAEFCNDYTARLATYGTPHPFKSEEQARKVLSQDTEWYNSSIETPMRGDGVDPPKFTLDSCAVIGVELPD